MESAVKILYTPEEQARQEIRNFVNEGLKDVQENALSAFKDVFDVFIVKYNYRKLQMRIGECCISKLEKVAKHSLKTLRNGVAPEW